MKLAAPKKFPFPTVSNHGMRAISGFFGEAIYQRPRPAGPILQQTGQSFGHIKDSRSRPQDIEKALLRLAF